MIKCIHVMGALSRSGAGVAKAVWEMSSALADCRDTMSKVVLAGIADSGWNGRPWVNASPSLEVAACRAWGPSSLSWSPALRRRLITESPKGLIIHSHGLWLHPNWAAASAARRRSLPLVISPHGMLCPWSFRHSQWKKRPVFSLIEKKNLESAACIVGSSDREAGDIRQFGFGGPIAKIPLGLDLSEFPDPEQSANASLETAWASFLEQYPQLRNKRLVLFMGRLHSVKAPEQLIEAFGIAAQGDDALHLLMAGPGELVQVQRLRKLIKQKGMDKRILLTGGVSGSLRLALLRKSSVLVLCSHNENFGYVVPEALASGRPVIVSSEVPWNQVAEVGCGWTYPHGVEGLAGALTAAAEASATELDAMGLRGRKWVESEFAWPEIAGRIIRLYTWLLDGGTPPDFVEMPS